MQAGAVNARYAEDKPWSCDYCYFQSPVTGTCELEACYYLLLETGEEPEEDMEGCNGCPYGRSRPCIGFCTQKLLMEMQIKKNEGEPECRMKQTNRLLIYVSGAARLQRKC